jgi:hypothetical protein
VTVVVAAAGPRSKNHIYLQIRTAAQEYGCWELRKMAIEVEGIAVLETLVALVVHSVGGYCANLESDSVQEHFLRFAEQTDAWLTYYLGPHDPNRLRPRLHTPQTLPVETVHWLKIRCHAEISNGVWYVMGHMTSEKV